MRRWAAVKRRFRKHRPEFWVLDRPGNGVVSKVKVDRDSALMQFAALLKELFTEKYPLTDGLGLGGNPAVECVIK